MAVELLAANGSLSLGEHDLPICAAVTARSPMSDSPLRLDPVGGALALRMAGTNASLLHSGSPPRIIASFELPSDRRLVTARAVAAQLASPPLRDEGALTGRRADRCRARGLAIAWHENPVVCVTTDLEQLGV